MGAIEALRVGAEGIEAGLGAKVDGVVLIGCVNGVVWVDGHAAAAEHAWFMRSDSLNWI